MPGVLGPGGLGESGLQLVDVLEPPPWIRGDDLVFGGAHWLVSLGCARSDCERDDQLIIRDVKGR